MLNVCLLNVIWLNVIFLSAMQPWAVLPSVILQYVLAPVFVAAFVGCHLKKKFTTLNFHQLNLQRRDGHALLKLLEFVISCTVLSTHTF